MKSQILFDEVFEKYRELVVETMGDVNNEHPIKIKLPQKKTDDYCTRPRWEIPVTAMEMIVRYFPNAFISFEDISEPTVTL